MDKKNIKFDVKLYCMFDRKAHMYSVPYAMVNQEVAVRDFLFKCKKADDQDYAQDLELYYVGDYSTEQGLLLTLDKPEFVIGYGG